MILPFSPSPTAGKIGSATTTVASHDFSADVKGPKNTVLLSNIGTDTIYWRFRTTADTAAATSADTALLAGTQQVFPISPDAPVIDYVGAATGSSLHAKLGIGV